MDYLREVTCTILPGFYLMVLLSSRSTSEMHAPCYSCAFYRLRHPQPTVTHVSPDGACSFPCYCEIRILKCNVGVKVIPDGCGCCNICSRQLGEPCNRRFRCDENQKLYCDFGNKLFKSGTVVNGTCAVRQPKGCHVDGVDYENGQQFNPNCSRLCTCRDGEYGCVSLCPQEEQPPEGSCSHAQLTPVPGQCCREWTCDPISSNTTDATTDLTLTGFQADENRFMWDESEPDIINSHEDVRVNKRKHIRTKSWDDLVSSYAQFPNTEKEVCKMNSSAWSPCSVTCGMGISVRMTTDMTTCQTVQQSQICYLRPCDKTELLNILENKRNSCTPTVKNRQKQKLAYDGCYSSEEKHFRFCGFCGSASVCLPRSTKTIIMEFDCGNGKKRALNVMWIRKCHCIKNSIVPSTLT